MQRDTRLRLCIEALQFEGTQPIAQTRLLKIMLLRSQDQKPKEMKHHVKRLPIHYT